MNYSTLIKDIVDHYNRQQDIEIRKCLKPKPKWLPKFIYHYILSKLIYIEFVNKSEKN